MYGWPCRWTKAAEREQLFRFWPRCPRVFPSYGSRLVSPRLIAAQSISEWLALKHFPWSSVREIRFIWFKFQSAFVHVDRVHARNSKQCYLRVFFVIWCDTFQVAIVRQKLPSCCLARWFSTGYKALNEGSRCTSTEYLAICTFFLVIKNGSILVTEDTPGSSRRTFMSSTRVLNPRKKEDSLSCTTTLSLTNPLFDSQQDKGEKLLVIARHLHCISSNTSKRSTHRSEKHGIEDKNHTVENNCDYIWTQRDVSAVGIRRTKFA